MKKLKNIGFVVLFVLCFTIMIPFFSGCTKTTELDTPTITNVYKQDENYYINFNEVENADDYTIFINNEEVTASSSPFLATNYLSENQMYEISMQANTIKTNYTNSKSSNLYYFNNKSSLFVPTIALNNNTVSWQNIENATLYSISINGVTFITNKTSVDLLTNENALSILIDDKIVYEIKVKANATAEYNGSDYSNTVYYSIV